MADEHPRIATLYAQVVASAAAATNAVPLVCPFAGTITSVSYVPVAAVTGADTNTRTLAVTNKGDDGTDTTAVASKALTSGNDLAAYDENALTLSGTAANLVVVEGDVLAFTSTHAASGLADPGGLVRITIAKTAAE